MASQGDDTLTALYHVPLLNVTSAADYCLGLLTQVLKLSLTHWGRVTHIWVSNLTPIGSVNGLSPGRRQAIIWTNAGLLLIGPFGTNFSEMRLKVSSAKRRPFCLGLNELTHLPRDNLAEKLETFSTAFSSMKMFELWLKYHWSVFLRGHLTMNQHWFR